MTCGMCHRDEEFCHCEERLADIDALDEQERAYWGDNEVTGIYVRPEWSLRESEDHEQQLSDIARYGVDR